MVKIETKQIDVDLNEYFDSHRLGLKIYCPTAIEQEFDYKSWERRTTNYPEVKITDEMRVKARTAFLAFCWSFYIGGRNDLEQYDNASLAKVPLADKHIRICTGYLDYVLFLLAASPEWS